MSHNMGIVLGRAGRGRRFSGSDRPPCRCLAGKSKEECGGTRPGHGTARGLALPEKGVENRGPE